MAIIKKRTIQHPGFEFFETDNSIYKQYDFNTDALVVGYFPRGPINQPMPIKNLKDYAVVFGSPESEAEITVYKGIQEILTSGGTVTAVRLPYDNVTLDKSGAEPAPIYKGIGYTFAEGNLNEEYHDITSAYHSAANVQLKNIVATVDNSITQAEIASIMAGTSDKDFTIINKYNDYLDKDDAEIFVSVFGAGNAIREQGLDKSEGITTINPLSIFKNGAFLTPPAAATTAIEKAAYFSRERIKWQTNGEIDANSELLTVGDSFSDSLPVYFPTINTVTKQDTTVITADMRTAKQTFNVVLPAGTVLPVVTTAGNSAITVNDVVIPLEKQTNNPKEIDAITLDLRVMCITEPSATAPATYSVFATYGSATFGDPAEEYLQLALTTAITDLTFETTITDAEADALGFWPTGNDLTFVEQFVDPSKDDYITVVVSKIRKSTIEKGRYTIDVLESFAGSIVKNTIDPVSKSSVYIGDIINESSSFISFYGKESYENYNPKTDVVTVKEQDAIRLSWVDTTGKEFKPAGAQAAWGTSLAKRIAADETMFSTYTDKYIKTALKKVKNRIKYTYRDVYDFGLSSVVSFATPFTADPDKNENGANNGYYYDPSKVVATETKDVGFIAAPTWKQVVNAFARHCRYDHTLSMFHADAPRKLFLNGTLSRIDDLGQDPLEVVATTKKIQAISIKDSTYVEVNAQWYEVQDDFNFRKMWIPNSVKMAGILTYNDINSNYWDAPAGHRFAVVKDVFRLAFNPEADLADRLYLNCINYGVEWPDGVRTIEGQKTCYSEQSALNRISVRRLLIWLERYTKTVAGTYLYEPNVQATRDLFVAELDTEFKRVKVLNGLNAYRLVCDEETNPPEVVDNNEMRIAIMVQPVRTAEFIIANFGVFKTGVNLEEVSAAF